jgi:hypothetical protein
MNMVAKIFEEENIKLFELYKCNRNTDKLAGLIESMRKFGWCNAYPMLCVALSNGKYEIIDGHHRFEAAKLLGVPVKFVIVKSSAAPSLFHIDDATSKWDMGDFLTSQCRGGNIEYSKVKKYNDETGIGIKQAASMLYGQAAGSGNIGRAFKSGEFVCRNTVNADVVGDIVRYMKKHGVSWAHHATLVKALSKVAFVTEFSPSKLKEKIKTYSYLIERRPHLEGYMDMLENLYNFKSSTKIPLRFLAEQKARERNVIKAK